MNSLPLTFAVGFEGKPKGTTASPNLEVFVRHVTGTEFTGSGKQCVDRTNELGTPITIPASSTTSLDLTSGLQNPLGESVSGGSAFAKVYAILIEHDVDSASSGITAFGGTVTEFQGPWAANDKATLSPGMGTAFWCAASKSGWTVASNIRIDIVNTSATSAATVNVLILGTTS